MRTVTQTDGSEGLEITMGSCTTPMRAHTQTIKNNLKMYERNVYFKMVYTNTDDILLKYLSGDKIIRNLVINSIYSLDFNLALEILIYI